MSLTLEFRYSEIYDFTLAKLRSDNAQDLKLDVSGGYAFVNRYSQHWKSINDQIIAYYAHLGLTLPHNWIVYAVHSQKGLMPFSDPLTITIKENLDEVTATLVHELCHTLLIQSYYSNTGVAQKLFDVVSAKYSTESVDTQWHIIVNILAKFGLEQIWDFDKVKTILELEKHYPGLERAWEIIDSKIGDQKFDDPTTAIQAV